MKIEYFKGEHPNFGDDLNTWMWPRIMPDFFNDNEKEVFLGIGSIIGEKQYAPTVKKILFGAGFVPEYRRVKPDTSGEDWNVYFVRGPRTARALGLPSGLGIGDSAILLRTLIKPRPNPSGVVSFIPHWESLERGNWQEVCRMAGINLIDPRTTVDDFMDQLMNSRMVITEAMHGAIVADAMRIPWVAVTPLNPIHRAKWLDWAEALDMHDLAKHAVWPSSLTEARISRLRKPIENSPFASVVTKGLMHAAAFRLTQLAKAEPTLSADSAIARATERMQENVVQLRKDHR